MSMTLTDRLHAQARIVHIKPRNRVKQIKKLANGDLQVILHSGVVYNINKDDVLFQSFVVYTVLAEV